MWYTGIKVNETGDLPMSESYRPKYHVSVPFGWANDPNGTIYYKGKAHLFYQYYPHKAEWGPMHWAHVTTEDFVHWDQRPTALCPDQPYEPVCGCCSGSAVEKDGRLYIMYTAAQPMMQRQCLAVSDDGDHFEKDPGNPILTAEMLSPEIYEEDFRDPRVFKHGDTYYLIAGIRYVEGGVRKEPAPQNQRVVTNPMQPSPEHKKEGWGNLCLLRGKDLYNWTYVGHLLYPQPELADDFFRLDGVYECPDYFVTDSGDEVLLSSPQNLPGSGNDYQNIHSVLYMTGHLDFDTGRFTVKKVAEVDNGFDFYAAQTLRMPDGRIIMIAWKEMWDRSFPSRKEEWAGTYSLPRELTTEDGELIQKPVREIMNFRGNEVRVPATKADRGEVRLPGVSGNVIELKFTIKPGTAGRSGVKVFCGEGSETLLYYDREEGLIVFDRKNSGIELTGNDRDVNRRVLEVGERDSIDFDMFLDVNSLEVFIDGGRHTMTGNVYPDPASADGIRFFAEDGEASFENIEKYDIVTD